MGSRDEREQTEMEASRWEVASIERVRPEDMEPILRWMSHPESIGHFDPIPQIPQNWRDRISVEEATSRLAAYYRNVDEEGIEEPSHILPITVRNVSGEAIAANTIRWRGDPYVPRDQRIASFERLIVNPEAWDKNIGTLLVAATLSICFDRYRGYRGVQGAKEVRAWIMTDREAGDFSRNINLFNKFGLKIIPRHYSWQEYAAIRGIETHREAYWYSIKQEDWEEFKGANKDIMEKVGQIINPADIDLNA